MENKRKHQTPRGIAYHTLMGGGGCEQCNLVIGARRGGGKSRGEEGGAHLSLCQCCQTLLMSPENRREKKNFGRERKSVGCATLTNDVSSTFFGGLWRGKGKKPIAQEESKWPAGLVVCSKEGKEGKNT